MKTAELPLRSRNLAVRVASGKLSRAKGFFYPVKFVPKFFAHAQSRGHAVKEERKFGFVPAELID